MVGNSPVHYDWSMGLKTLLLALLIPYTLCTTEVSHSTKLTHSPVVAHTTEVPEVATDEVIPNSSYTGRSKDEIEKIFKKHKIIPDLIDEAPEYEFNLRFVGGIWPDFGTKHKPDELRYPPYAFRYPFIPHVMYSMFMFDLDAPSVKNASKRAYYHWGLANIPKYNILSAETLAEYLRPEPEKGTGSHRFVFLIYKQPFGKTLYMEPRLLHLPDDTHRANWDIRAIVKKYKLEGPVAGNFLYCKWAPPSDNPFMGHDIMSDPVTRGTAKPITTLIPPDVLEESDVEGADP